MTVSELKEKISRGELDETLAARCGVSPERLPELRRRILRCADSFARLYDEAGERDVMLFSVGGRSEISGNHTDHNRGRVIAAAVSLQIIAVASPRADGIIRLSSEGCRENLVLPGEIDAPNPEKQFSSDALIAGMSRAVRDGGWQIGGFDATTVSDVPRGSGLSSSAAFEVLVGTILSHLYNGGAVGAVELAKMAQFAENVYYGKPCGLMDQMACAVGGLITIDFADADAPAVQTLPLDLGGAGYDLCITATGGSHADLNGDYAAVPGEMHDVAAALGVSVLRESSPEQLLAALPRIREACGDRAVLRALHFFSENDRVREQADALRDGDLDRFFALVRASGRSSFSYLQNVFTPADVEHQGVSLALCLTERFLTKQGRDRGAWRVHGGGFAGTVQAFVPHALSAQYKSYMETVFGEGSVHVLQIRPAGAIRLL